MHVTLAFIGNVPDDRLADVVAAAHDAAASRTPFELRLAGLGTFPERGAAHVVWLGFADAAPLIDLADRARAALTTHSVDFDGKPFRPHLTLARVRDDADRVEQRDIAQAIRGATPPAGSFRVDALDVIQSVLSPKGPRYTSRATVSFGVGGTR
jgi:RNA 2',3'-cyclic 3'-phosphodiesterase